MVTTLNDRLTDASWRVFRALDINNDGLILAHAFDAAKAKHAVLLIPGTLAADANRNGAITFDGKDASTQLKPFRFWINGDQDTGDVASDGSDLPGATSGANYSDNQVNGRCDLIDFFPVALELGEALKMMPTAKGYEYHLSQADEAVNFVYTDLERANAFDYLTQPDNQVYGSSFKQQAFAADTIQVTKSGTKLSDEFLNKIKDDGEKGVVLIEGRAQTTEPLVLEIWRNGHKLAGMPLYLSIDGVEKMYRWINLRSAANGDVGKPTDINPPHNFPDSESNGKQFIFLHGFRCNENDGREYSAEMFKRLWQSGSKSMFTAVTWRGDQSVWFDPWGLDYYDNVRNAFLTAASLKDAVAALPGTQKYISAHSLGNMVVSSAIKDYHMNVAAYFAIDAAIAMEAFDGSLQQFDMVNPGIFSTFNGWKNYDHRLWPTEWYQLFSPDKGFADDGRYGLTWRDRFGTMPNLYNFYSSGEEILMNTDGRNPSPVDVANTRERVWVFGEMGKGGGLGSLVSHIGQGGWALNTGWYILPAGARPGGNKQPRRPWEATANEISDDALRSQPFFRDFRDSRLVDPQQGSAAAKEVALRAEVLGAGIPALSHATGANRVAAFRFGSIDRNFNLSASQSVNGQDAGFETGWPQVRRDGYFKERWMHSDLKNVAYPFNHKFHDKLVELGGLNNEN